MTSVSANPRQLIEDSQGLVRSLAAQIHRKTAQKADLEDLIAYGQVGLAEAARDFDPERGNEFSTYAYYRIRGAIYDGLSKMNWFGRTHYQQVRYEQKANEVLKSSNEAATPPRTGDEEVDARWFRDLSCNLMVVYLATGSQLNDGRLEAFPVEDQSTPLPPAVVIGRETCQKLNELINTLPANEAKLIRSTYFEGLTLQEAGEKLGISKSWASRLHDRILKKLARSLKLSGMAS